MADDDDGATGGGGGPATDDSSRSSKVKKGLKSAGRSASQVGQRQIQEAASQASARSDVPSPNSTPRYTDVDSYKKGGRVKKTGRALLHRGEVVKSGGKRKKGRKYSGRM